MLSNRKQQLKQVFEDTQQFYTENPILASAVDASRKNTKLYEADDYPDLPILNVPNLFVTPHIGFATEEAMDLRAQIVFESVRAWLDGGQNSVVVPRND